MTLLDAKNIIKDIMDGKLILDQTSNKYLYAFDKDISLFKIVKTLKGDFLTILMYTDNKFCQLIVKSNKELIAEKVRNIDENWTIVE